MVLLELSVVPLGEGVSVSRYVARCLDIIDSSGLDYRLNAMGTTVEGELSEVLGVLRQCIEAIAQDCDRVTCTAKLDYRKGLRGRLTSKITSVQDKVGRPLRT